MAEVSYYQAAGNRFALVESRSAAEGVLRGSIMGQLALDGILVFGQPEAGGDCRMEIINRDGSTSAACGNGLRCIAHFAFERRDASGRLSIETSAGRRYAERVVHGAPGIIRTSMGTPRIVELDTDIDGHHAAIVDMGNPHCVLMVDDVDSAPVAELGSHLEQHPRFPDRTNVEFVQVTEEKLNVRVWERGVGETAACGTGASAAAAVMLKRGLQGSPIELQLPGGLLTATWVGKGELYLEGPVARLKVQDRGPVAHRNVGSAH